MLPMKHAMTYPQRIFAALRMLGLWSNNWPPHGGRLMQDVNTPRKVDQA